MSSLRSSYRQIASPLHGAVLRPMTDDGLITGLDSQNLDYTGQNKKFWIQPTGSEDWRIATFAIALSSTGAQPRTDYGSISGGLVTGINFFAEIDGVEQIITSGAPIKNNQHLVRNGRSFGLFDFDAADDSIFAEDNFLTYSDGFVLRGSKNEKFGIIINDDLSALSQHQVFVKAANLGPRVV